MIDKFKTILASITEKGRIDKMAPVALFAILKMDEVEDKWSVIFANELTSLTDEEKNSIFSNLIDEIKKTLSNDELSQIIRVGVFTIEDHLVQALLHYPTGKTILNEKVNGNLIHEGYILKGAETISQDIKPVDLDKDQKIIKS